MASMTSDPTYAMAVRTGNWGSLVMLSFHKPVVVDLAPIDEPTLLVSFASGITGVPQHLTIAEVEELTVSDGGGRAVLRVGGAEHVRRDAPTASGSWELRLEGEQGLLVLYARENVPFPTNRVLDDLAARMVGTRSG